MAQMRLLADEVLLLDLRARHAGLDDVVLRLELGAVGAVALLEPPGGGVDADAAGHEPVRLAGLPERVPHARALLDRHVQLPAEVADVRDARGERDLRADLELLAGAEAEALVRDVVGGDCAQDVAGARAPEADRRPRRRDVDEPVSYTH